MNKYANIEQIKEVIRTEWVRHMPMDLDPSLSFILAKVSEVPTIEVCDDCISREQIIKAHYDWCNKHKGIDDVFYIWSLKLMRNAPSVIVSTQIKEGECD